MGGHHLNRPKLKLVRKLDSLIQQHCFGSPFFVASIKIGVNELELVFISFLFSPVSFSFLTFSYHWFSTRNNTTCNNCVCVFAYFVLLVWSCLLFYLSEKRMNGWREMTGDSSNIGCLEALAVPSTNNSAQSALKALIPAGLYTRGCILWCIQRGNTLHCILCILCIFSSSSRGMFYRVGDKPWLITEAHVTLLALHLSQTE